jgi:hypothetical protein
MQLCQQRCCLGKLGETMDDVQKQEDSVDSVDEEGEKIKCSLCNMLRVI